jgi:hypothetical protein
MQQAQSNLQPLERLGARTTHKGRLISLHPLLSELPSCS